MAALDDPVSFNSGLGALLAQIGRCARPREPRPRELCWADADDASSAVRRTALADIAHVAAKLRSCDGCGDVCGLFLARERACARADARCCDRNGQQSDHRREDCLVARCQRGQGFWSLRPPAHRVCRGQYVPLSRVDAFFSARCRGHAWSACDRSLVAGVDRSCGKRRCVCLLIASVALPLLGCSIRCV